MPGATQHYERAFDLYLRARGVAYVRVEEARRVLLPVGRPAPSANLKFFDYVVYGTGEHLLVELKGRRLPAGVVGGRSARLECWATEADVASLARWEALFGAPFVAVIVFVYWCGSAPPGALFQEVFEAEGRWYAARAVRVGDYAAHMRARSARWRTVDLPPADFERISYPFAPGRAV
ncbi:MAG: HYExAFE family protein [Phycisphaerales bacterium]